MMENLERTARRYPSFLKFTLPALAAAAILSAGCCSTGSKLTAKELGIIDSADSAGVMRVLTVYNRADSLFLRAECRDFSEEDLTAMFSDSLSAGARLARQMVSTVTDPSQDGVGIAGPQVGVGRRIVAVMRYDKPGKPFEVYPNIRIEETFGEKKVGPEGCLSIPGLRGKVERWDSVVVRYARICSEPISDRKTWEYVRDTVGGYSAVIFQHECDHLGGVLYTDRATSISKR